MAGSVLNSPVFADITEKSVPNVLGRVDVLAKQLNLLTRSAGNQFGSITGARRSPKPFIVGFIVPDNPINFIPITRSLTKVDSISGGSNTTGAPQATMAAIKAPPTGGGSSAPGLQKKASHSFSADDLRAALADSYTQIVGHAPSEATLSLIYAQICCEIGGGPAQKVFAADNYNLGNVHAGGGTSRYVNDDPKQGPISTPTQPTGGSFFLTTDFDSHNKPYACYMQSFASLAGGAHGQVAALVGNWPGTVDATTPEDFNTALLNGKHGKYYEAPPKAYLDGLKMRQALYYKQFGVDPPPSGSLTVSGNAGNNTASTDPLDPTGQNRAIMSDGVSTDPEDPLGDTLGRNIQPDDARFGIARQQVLALQAQIDAMRLVPPLLLLVNPSSFDRSYEKTTDSGSKGRQGNIVHAWTDGPGDISCKGMTAAQYAVAADGSGGLTGANRVFSLSYQNLLSLVMMYRNNGMIYTDELYAENGSQGIGFLPASVYIYYDGHVYIGSFDDFSVDDTADKPHNMEYSFKFKVRYDIEAPEVADLFLPGVG